MRPLIIERQDGEEEVICVTGFRRYAIGNAAARSLRSPIMVRSHDANAAGARRHDGGDMTPGRQLIDVTSGAARRPFLVAVLGFALLYAVCVSFFYSSWLVGQPDFSVTMFDNALNPSIFLASVLFSLIVGAKLPVKRLPLLIVGYVAFAAAIGGMIAAALTGAAPGLVSGAAIAAGVGMGFVMPFYFELFAPYSSRAIAAACGMMSLGGMAIAMVADLLPSPVGFALYAACLAGSACCFAYAARRWEGAGAGATTAPASTSAAASPASAPAGKALSRRDFLDVFLVSGICTFALSIVYGIVDTAAMGGSFSPEVSLLISQFGGIAAAIVFLLYFGTRSNPSPSLLFNVVFGILATGILFLPFLSGDYAVSLNILAAAGWKLVMLSLFFLVVVTYAHDGKRLLVGISLAYALPRLGLFIGQNIALFLGIGSTADFVRMTAVTFFLLYLVLMVIWMVNSHERKKAVAQARVADELLDRMAHEQQDVRRARCDVLADEHGLTNREKDILYLLAQGRDLAFICETLFLSKNTVKSYQKTIYAKLDVHSKQEIIDRTQD